jgi:type 1 glutamine amidotransferase
MNEISHGAPRWAEAMMPLSASLRRRLILLLQALAALLASALTFPAMAADTAPKHLLIVGQGPDGHPLTTHEFMPGAKVLAELLKPFPEIQTTVVDASEPWPDGPKLIDAADGIVMLVSQGAQWMQIDEARYAALKRLAARGGAIVALHWSVGAKEDRYIQGQLDLLGATRGGNVRPYKKLAVDLKRADPQHPILSGISDFKAYDEFYYALVTAPGIHPLLTENIDGKDEMSSWAWDRPDGGRAFGFVALHFHSNWQLPEYRRLIVQGVLWSLKLPIPDGGVNVDIDSKKLELNGVLPPPAGPNAEPKKKSVKKESAGS